MDPQTADAVRGMAVREAIHRAAQEFTDHLLEIARTTVLVEEIGKESVRDGLHELWNEGWPVDDEDEADPIGFAHPADWHRLLAEKDRIRRMPGNHEPLRVEDRVEFYTEKTLEEGTILLVHPYATAPTPVHKLNRPWIVREPSGLVIVKVNGQ